MVMDGDLAWAGAHATPCTDDALWDRAPETCITLLPSVAPIDSTKRKKVARH